MKQPTKIQLGKQLRKLREKKGLSHYSIHKSHGLRSEISKGIEDGSKSYTFDSLMLYLEAIGSSLIITSKDDSICDHKNITVVRKKGGNITDPVRHFVRCSDCEHILPINRIDQITE